MNLHELAFAIIFYLKERGYRYSEAPGHKNLIYLEGAFYFAGQVTPNYDTPDGWDDLRLLLEFLPSGQPVISHIAKATCEPGTAATFSLNSAKNNGVARLQLTQYLSAAKMGFHKGGKRHPALVQVGTILVHRDKNRDQKRTGDLISKATGINHHGTRPGFSGTKVGMWSEGCCVGYNWNQHMAFIELMRADPRYIKDNEFAWDFCLIDSLKIKNVLL